MDACQMALINTIIKGIKKAHHRLMMGFKNIPGDDLLSHDLTIIVSSALESLTSVFGMGTGVTPPV